MDIGDFVATISTFNWTAIALVLLVVASLGSAVASALSAQTAAAVERRMAAADTARTIRELMRSATLVTAGYHTCVDVLQQCEATSALLIKRYGASGGLHAKRVADSIAKETSALEEVRKTAEALPSRYEELGKLSDEELSRLQVKYDALVLTVQLSGEHHRRTLRKYEDEERLARQRPGVQPSTAAPATAAAPQDGARGKARPTSAFGQE